MPDTKPRIILWDIETVMNVLATFRLMNQDPIPHRNILQERYVVSFAWKELDEKRTHSYSLLDDPERFGKDVHDDTSVVEMMHTVLSSADVIVAHNGDNYDIKFAETRMVQKGLPPLPPIPSIDTLKVARSRFLFNNNRLDYLGQFFGIGHKKSNEEDLWLKVLNGDEHAIREMVKYNRTDVDPLLEGVFRKLQPYVPQHINHMLFDGQNDIRCPQCGKKHFEHRGFHYSATQKYPRYRCLECGRWFRGRSAEKPTPLVRALP